MKLLIWTQTGKNLFLIIKASYLSHRTISAQTHKYRFYWFRVLHQNTFPSFTVCSIFYLCILQMEIGVKTLHHSCPFFLSLRNIVNILLNFGGEVVIQNISEM